MSGGALDLVFESVGLIGLVTRVRRPLAARFHVCLPNLETSTRIDLDTTFVHVARLNLPAAFVAIVKLLSHPSKGAQMPLPSSPHGSDE